MQQPNQFETEPARPQATSGFVPPVNRSPRSRRGWLFGAIGLIVAALVVFLVASFLNRFQQTVTTGPHITKIQVGTGLDSKLTRITGETDSFQTGQTVFLVFTVVTEDPNAQIILKLYADGKLQDTSAPLTPDSGTNQYSSSASVQTTGASKFEVDYNGTAEATITFNVT